MVLTLAASSPADVIRLKNGNQMEGVIRSETAAEYQVDMGFGTVGIRKDQVAGVARATGDERAQWEATRRTAFILHEKYVPAGQRDLLAALQGLETQREGALKAQRGLADLQQTLAREAQALEQLRELEVEVAGRLVAPAKPTSAELAQYNRVVVEVNGLRNRAAALQQKLPERQAAIDQGRQESVRYTSALLLFADRVQQRKAQGAGADDPRGAADFFAAVEARLKTYQGELQRVQLSYQTNAQHMVVKARLNDQVEGLFMVDTGATLMTISAELAGRLQLPAGPADTTVTLADGSRCQARRAVLRSVAIDGARVANVAAVILPTRPGEGLDGLLGMNFLKEFSVQLDTVARVMVLYRFAPR
jgi:clan AA aspartic protease (TIGR02281 family)